jgi:hypothetical protein
VKLRNSETAKVPYELAKERVLAYLRKSRSLEGPARIAEEIWPGHKMRAQGAGFAATAILLKMKKEGLVRRSYEKFGKYTVWGWEIA